jgi:hypothetical protein
VKVQNFTQKTDTAKRFAACRHCCVRFPVVPLPHSDSSHCAAGKHPPFQLFLVSDRRQLQLTSPKRSGQARKMARERHNARCKFVMAFEIVVLGDLED